MHVTIPIQRLRNNLVDEFRNVSGFNQGYIELCRVTGVKDGGVSAYFPATYRHIENILFPAGPIQYIPNVGDIGLAIVGPLGQYVILGFCNNLEESNLEGEVLIQGPDKSFIKFDKLGGVMLSNAFFAYTHINEYGEYLVNVENAIYVINGTNHEQYTLDYTKYMDIIKGIHSSDSGVELCYEIRLNDKLVFGITKDGKLLGDFNGKGI